MAECNRLKQYEEYLLATEHRYSAWIDQLRPTQEADPQYQVPRWEIKRVFEKCKDDAEKGPVDLYGYHRARCKHIYDRNTELNRIISEEERQGAQKNINRRYNHCV